MKMTRFLSIGLVCALAAFGCDDEDDTGGAGGADMGVGGEGGGLGGMGGMGGMGGEGGGMACEAEAVDYPGDAWDACISDDGAYVLAGDSAPSSIARIAAFEQMGDALWNNAGAASPDDFIDAQIIFTDDEGIGSRVGRRYDSHVEAPEGSNCRETATATPFPDYCVGPAQMLPIINDAFDAGARAEGNAFAHARRVEAALLWFLYVSTYKEANTCFGTAKDCDSAWAYFGGGNTASDPASGLGARVQAIDSGAYAAMFDALLAVRCWRDLDDGEIAEDDTLFNQADAQLDTALDYAYSRVIIANLEAYAATAAGLEKDGRWAGLEVFGTSIDRAARARDAAAADRLAAVFASDEPDTDAAISELEILFPCP
jgi:hypothetical protein